ncbi:MAG: HTH-type transcriptional regulator DegA [Lentisphaerae bacterium ADurb.Bin242]|nr:MAG: HTH-type transcriptional regulator DegA [Lentisphaerae bacterium ADurb.Bin242]
MITMQDIAVAAGVSQPTVSLVLNGHSGIVRISEKTRNHILAAAKKLGYTKNALALAVKTGKTNIIGMVCLLSSKHVPNILSGFNSRLQEKGYLMKLFGIVYEEPEEFERSLRQCIEQRVAGMACISIKREHLMLLKPGLDKAGIPLVCIDSFCRLPNVPNIHSDDCNGMRKIVKYITGLGHRKIGYILNFHPRNPERMLEDANTRFEGFKAGMKEAGLPFDKNKVACISPMSRITPEELVTLDRLYDLFNPTALVCCSDIAAMKVLHWAYKRRIRVPDTLSVTGFAGLSECNITAPSLTTMAQPFGEMGSYAAETIIHLSAGKKGKGKFFPVELVPGESTGPMIQSDKEKG